jgi:hypothetical protein
MTELTSFRITYTDGTSYTTSCAAGTTLDEAKSYFMQAPHVSEDASGKETRRYVETVEQVISEPAEADYGWADAEAACWQGVGGKRKP